MNSNTPFYNQLAELSQLSTRFFMPGHKGNSQAIPPLASLLKYDMTEIEGADDLSHPTGPLMQSQKNMTRAFGSGATLYSASGSTSCVQAMLTLFVKPGETVILARDCHASAVRALAFLDGKPVWVAADENGRYPLHSFEKALQKYPGAPVYVTSPGYYGHMADIPGLANLCRAYKSPLLVDNAHGAYLKFLPNSLHPISLGADACADSAHKTLPCLTPAALLHLKDPQLEGAARTALNLYSSTSPSFIVLQSLDLAAGLLLETPPDFSQYAEKVLWFENEFKHLIEPCDDPLRLCIYPARGGWTGPQVYDSFIQAGIYPELYDTDKIIFMISPYNTEEDFQKLERVLRQFSLKEPIYRKTAARVLPEVVVSIRQALFGDKEHIPVEQAAGRIAADIQAPCPPGIPIILPGEKITNEGAALLKAGGIFQLDVLK